MNKEAAWEEQVYILSTVIQTFRLKISDPVGYMEHHRATNEVTTLP